MSDLVNPLTGIGVAFALVALFLSAVGNRQRKRGNLTKAVRIGRWATVLSGVGAGLALVGLGYELGTP